MKVIVSYQKLFIKKTMKYIVAVITLLFAVANGKGKHFFLDIFTAFSISKVIQKELFFYIYYFDFYHPILILITIFSAILNCEYPLVLLTSGSCDGTCEDPTPPCAFTKILRERCGCPPGKVIDADGYCVPVYMCELRPGKNI